MIHTSSKSYTKWKRKSQDLARCYKTNRKKWTLGLRNIPNYKSKYKNLHNCKKKLNTLKDIVRYMKKSKTIGNSSLQI